MKGGGPAKRETVTLLLFYTLSFSAFSMVEGRRGCLALILLKSNRNIAGDGC